MEVRNMKMKKALNELSKLLTLMCLLAATVSISVYATDYIEVYARDYAPSPITGSFPYTSVDVWRYTDDSSFGSGGYGGADPVLNNPPYCPGVGYFIEYSWTVSYTDVARQVPIYKLEGNSWVFVCYLYARVWFWPNGNYGGYYEHSGFVTRVH
ncbi:MAG: hypothetical protein QW797_09540 [Thermoproteota archaeon]